MAKSQYQTTVDPGFGGDLVANWINDSAYKDSPDTNDCVYREVESTEACKSNQVWEGFDIIQNNPLSLIKCSPLFEFKTFGIPSLTLIWVAHFINGCVISECSFVFSIVLAKVVGCHHLLSGTQYKDWAKKLAEQEVGGETHKRVRILRGEHEWKYHN